MGVFSEENMLSKPKLLKSLSLLRLISTNIIKTQVDAQSPQFKVSLKMTTNENCALNSNLIPGKPWTHGAVS